MPSPFPGMDPFLESQYFGSLHGKMITYLEESMQDRLPEDYFAISKERVWIDTASWIEPDVLVGRAGNFVKGTLKPSAGVATMAKPVTVAVPLGERTEPFCTIEIPSPSEVLARFPPQTKATHAY
ncbi:MAG: DUF4058 family protein [Planctomycetes bacterium]|nr:DUF4058 family protein [Planctomycetota bacterium]